MKKALILGLSLLALNTLQAQDLCSNLIVTETIKIKTTLKNTKHDYFGESDEILLELSSSTHKLDEDNMFSDWLGISTYKQAPENFLGRLENSVPFFETKTIGDKEVAQELLYGRFLNLVIVDRDIEVPLASGSIEVPFHFAAGGNHDDLIFSKSVKLDLTNQKAQNLVVANNLGDEVVITLSPGKVKTLSRAAVQEELVRAKLNVKTQNKASYLKDLLDGKIKNACADI